MKAEREAGTGGARRCAHTYPSGKPCGGYAITGSAFCFAHSPDRGDQRAAARRKGGQAGKAVVLPEAQISLRTVDDVVGLVELTVNAVLTGRVDVRIANAVGVLANVALKALQQGELDQRLAALEAVLEPERARSVSIRRR